MFHVAHWLHGSRFSWFIDFTCNPEFACFYLSNCMSSPWSKQNHWGCQFWFPMVRLLVCCFFFVYPQNHKLTFNSFWLNFTTSKCLRPKTYKIILIFILITIIMEILSLCNKGLDVMLFLSKTYLHHLCLSRFFLKNIYFSWKDPLKLCIVCTEG